MTNINTASTKKLWPILITSMFASFMNPFMLSAVNIGLPNIQTSFECSALTLSWVNNSFLLANAIILLPISKAADIWGRIKFFKAGLYIFTIFSLLAALSNNIPMLMTMRVFQGAGAALMHVTGVAIVTEAFPINKRGIALGLNIGAVYTGLSLGPYIGGLLTQIGGWQYIFFSAVPIGIVAIILSHSYLKTKKTSIKKVSFDYKGSLIYSLAIVAFVYGGGKINSKYGLFIMISGIILMSYFFFFEKKARNPILKVDLLKNNKPFTYSNLAALIQYSSTFGIGFLLSIYLQISKGLNPKEAGLVLVIQPIIMAISAPITGRLSDKIRPGLIASVGLLMTLFALILLTFISNNTSIYYITIVLILLGLSFGLFTSPNTNAIMSAVNKNEYGIASGINATMRVFGQTISMMVATIFISIYLGKSTLNVESVEPFIKSMKIYFIFFAIFCLPGIWFSVKRSKI